MQEIDQTTDSHERNKSLEVLGIRSKMEAGKGISQNQRFLLIRLVDKWETHLSFSASNCHKITGPYLSARRNIRRIYTRKSLTRPR